MFASPTKSNKQGAKQLKQKSNLGGANEYATINDTRSHTVKQLKLQEIADNYSETSSFAVAQLEGTEVSPNHKDIAGLAALLSQEGADPSGFSDPMLLEILTESFEANWFKAKACLAMNKWPPAVTPPPDHNVSLKLMQSLVNMRGRVWEKFSIATLPLIAEAVSASGVSGIENAATQDDNLKIGSALGSQSVTSDIDLSLKGANTEIGVALINKEFKKRFNVPYEPGTMFDINVYSSDWMHGKTEVQGEATVATYAANAEAAPSTEAGKAKRADKNELWSTVKIRRNLSDISWLDYKTTYLSNLEGNESQIAASEQLFDQVDIKHSEFKTRVAEQSEAFRAELVAAERQLLKEKASNFDSSYQKDALAMKASNAIYETLIRDVKALRIRLKALKAAGGSPEQIEADSVQLADKIGEALTYANEVYASEGAVLHTVLGKQSATKIKDELNDEKNKETSRFAGEKGTITAVKFNLSKENYLESVNENVGDAIHSLHHYEDKPTYAVYRAGKYLDRLCEAAGQLITEEIAISLPNYNTLLTIASKSVEAKDGEAGRDPLALDKPESFFSRFQAEDIAIVTTQTLAFGAKVASTYKKNKGRIGEIDEAKVDES
jgi:hypothetical protein